MVGYAFHVYKKRFILRQDFCYPFQKIFSCYFRHLSAHRTMIHIVSCWGPPYFVHVMPGHTGVVTKLSLLYFRYRHRHFVSRLRHGRYNENNICMTTFNLVHVASRQSSDLKSFGKQPYHQLFDFELLRLVCF